MDAAKPWYRSQTIISVAVMVLCQVLVAVNHSWQIAPADQTALVDLISEGVTVIGGILAAHGRVTASTAIGSNQ